LHDDGGVRHVLSSVAKIRAAKEIVEGRDDTSGIGGSAIDEDIKVHCGARAGVKRDRVSADDQIPDSMSI
jgi:hypothetical protein